MGDKLEHLAKLLDEALGIAEEMLRRSSVGDSELPEPREVERIISGIKYIRKQVSDGRLEPSEGRHTLGILYVASENAYWDSPIVRKANEIEEYYLKHLQSPDDFAQ